ncbi:MAG: thymidine phosphorylase, partial [Rhodococcus sp. (in: high G+C Gram-positive bacteria)]
GVRLHAKPGDRVVAGQQLATLYTDTPEKFDYATEAISAAWSIGDSAPGISPIVLDRVGR